MAIGGSSSRILIEDLSSLRVLGTFVVLIFETFLVGHVEYKKDHKMKNDTRHLLLRVLISSFRDL